MPALVGKDVDLAVQNAQLAAQTSDDSMSVDQSSSSSSQSSSTEEASLVTLVIPDGVIVDPSHCAFEDCI